MFADIGNRINALLGKQQMDIERGAKLGFCFERAEATDRIEEFGYPLRAITKSGNGYMYSIYADIRPDELRKAENTKGKIISILSSSDAAYERDIENVKALAKSVLSSVASPERIDMLSYIIAHDTAGYGPISILMEDRHNIEEIEINSPDSCISVFLPRYGRCLTNLRFAGAQQFRSTINRMISNTEKELSDGTPIIDAQIENLRLHAQIKPYALSGAAATIRIGGRKDINLRYLMENRTADADMLAYLWIAFEAKQNMVISGAPASGKTTLLSALAAFVPSNEKIITIEEDINEINSTGMNNVVGLYGSRYGSINPKEQVINSLRMRPGRIFLGEMRGEEARDLFMSANLGISFAATMHSNEGGMQILKKLIVKPMCVEIKSLSMLDIAVYMKQADISRRSLSSISEYRWLSRAETMEGTEVSEEEMVNICDIASGAVLDRSALKESKVIGSYARMHGITVKDALKELDRRSKFIATKATDTGVYKSVEEAVKMYEGW